MNDYLKIPELARRLDVSEKTIRRYIKAGMLRSSFIGGTYRVTEGDLEEYLAAREVHPKAAAPPEITVAQLREYGIEANPSEVIVLNQYLSLRETPPTGIHALGHVIKENEPVDHERVKTILAYVLYSGMLTPEQVEAAGENLRGELVGAKG